jgi:hypothetical protein
MNRNSAYSIQQQEIMKVLGGDNQPSLDLNTHQAPQNDGRAYDTYSKMSEVGYIYYFILSSEYILKVIDYSSYPI